MFGEMDVQKIIGENHVQKFTVKLSDGVLATSYKRGKYDLMWLFYHCLNLIRAKGDKFFISPDKLLPMERFTQPNSSRYALYKL